jgi:hypothetical protein
MESIITHKQLGTGKPIGRLNLRLADGTKHVWLVGSKRPRYINSRAMDDMPYGTQYLGCTWTRERLAS